MAESFFIADTGRFSRETDENDVWSPWTVTYFSEEDKKYIRTDLPIGVGSFCGRTDLYGIKFH